MSLIGQPDYNGKEELIIIIYLRVAFSDMLQDLQANLIQQDRTRSIMDPKINQIQHLANIFEDLDNKRRNEPVSIST